MDFEELFFHSTGLYVELFSFFSFQELAQLETVNRTFCEAIRGSGSLWRRVARQILRDKKFWPAVVERLLTPGNTRDRRVDLEAMSVRELRALASDIYGLNTSGCLEKSEIVQAVHSRECRKMLRNECPARFAVRVMLRDATRNCIRREELHALTFQVRVRRDGPLSHLAPNDPYWQGSDVSVTTRFLPNGVCDWNFTGPSPFAFMLQQMGQMRYTLDPSGAYVLLSVGVREYIGRHPVHWGWILASGGTFWTGFEMPRLGQDVYTSDEYIEKVITDEYDKGFEL